MPLSIQSTNMLNKWIRESLYPIIGDDEVYASLPEFASWNGSNIIKAMMNKCLAKCYIYLTPQKYTKLLTIK